MDRQARKSIAFAETIRKSVEGQLPVPEHVGA
jgi:hypothetical protein